MTKKNIFELSITKSVEPLDHIKLIKHNHKNTIDKLISLCT